MTDKELLKLASKAANVSGEYRTERLCIGGDWDDITAIFLDDDMGYWNPLTDDGDALRLAVKLNLQLTIVDYGSTARAGDGMAWNGEKHKRGDKCAATRRAIVKAAAELGKAME